MAVLLRVLIGCGLFALALDELSGATMTNDSGNGHHGTYFGSTPVDAAAYPTGTPCRELDATIEDYAQLQQDLPLPASVTEKITIAAWIRPGTDRYGPFVEERLQEEMQAHPEFVAEVETITKDAALRMVVVQDLVNVTEAIGIDIEGNAKAGSLAVEMKANAVEKATGIKIKGDIG